jgi:hypothetical protein
MGKRIERAKQHLQENKKTYLACGATAVVAVVGTLLVLTRKEPLISQPISWKPRAEITQATINLVERSTPSKPVHLVGTNLYWSSLSEAARETGHPLAMISKNVNGHIPNVNGDVFEVLELAA